MDDRAGNEDGESGEQDRQPELEQGSHEGLRVEVNRKSTQRSAFSIQHSAFSIQRSAFS
jgi:hypothetical protein